MNGPATLETDAFRSLGRRWMGVRTAISPLESGSMPLEPAHQASLQHMGLIDAGGRPTPELNRVLSVLGQATTVVDLTVLGKEKSIEHSVYFAPGGAAPVLVTTAGNSTTIYPSASPDPVLGDLADTMKGTIDEPGAFSIDLSTEDALILVALMDQQRQSALALPDAHSSAPVPPVVFYPYEIEQILNTFTSALPSWPLMALTSTVTGSTALSGDEIGQALFRMVSGGYLVRSGQGYIFRQNPLSFINRLLAPEFSIMCSILTLRSQGSISREEFNSIGFNGGIFSLVYRSDDAGTICFRAMAKDSMLDVVRRLVVSPRSFAESMGLSPLPVSELTSPQESAPAASFCPACGAAVAPGANFCRSCGAPLAAPAGPPTCPKCGQQVREGAKFCNRCGQQLG